MVKHDMYNVRRAEEKQTVCRLVFGKGKGGFGCQVVYVFQRRNERRNERTKEKARKKESKQERKQEIESNKRFDY